MLQKTFKFLAVAALFLIPIFPLFVANSFFFPFITGKAFYFRILVEIGFASWLVLTFLDAKYRPRITPLFVGVTVFALVALVADFLGVNPIRSFWSNFERMEGWVTIIHLWAFFVTAEGLFGAGEEGRRLWHRWINMELGVAVIVAIYGFMQLLGFAAIHQGSTRIDASLGNAAYMAVYMLWNAGLAFYMFLIARVRGIANSSFMKWVYPVLALVFAFELFETGTRGTILALLGGILLALFLYAVLGKNESTRARWTAGGIIIAILVLGGVFWAERNSSFVQNNDVLQRMASISWSEAQGQARNYIWPMAIQGFLDRPILGWGQENFNYVFNANYNPKMWTQEQWFDRAHSVYLDWLANAGILGLIAYLALYVLCVTTVWKTSRLTIAEKSALTGLIVGYAIHNIFVFDNLASYLIFFAALAFLNSFRDGRPIGWFGSGSMSRDAVTYVAVPVTIVALLVLVYFLDARPMTANTRLIGALENCVSPSPSVAVWNSALSVNTYVANQEIREQLLSCAGRVIQNDQIAGQTKQDFFNLSQTAIASQARATRWGDARIFALGGAFMNSISQFKQAQPLLEAAARLSPHKQSIDVELATDYINNRAPEKAVALLAPDYAAAPDNENVRSTYALALIVTKNEKAALDLYGGDASKLVSVNAAEAYTIAGNLTKAISIYKQLIAADPGNINVAIALARLQYTVGDRAGAVATFRALEKSHPEFKDAIEAAIQQAESQ